MNPCKYCYYLLSLKNLEFLLFGFTFETKKASVEVSLEKLVKQMRQSRICN